MQILIIEDDSDLAANLYDYLETKGHHAETAYGSIVNRKTVCRFGASQ